MLQINRLAVCVIWLAILCLRPASARLAKVHDGAFSDSCVGVTNLEALHPGHGEEINLDLLIGFIMGMRDEMVRRNMADYDINPPDFSSHEQWLAFLAFCKDHPSSSKLDAAVSVSDMLRQLALTR